jgi:ubiquinone/menaquinone biosynthesis C-methylase UbiE
MNAFGRASMNNPLRVAAQERYIVPKMLEMGGDLSRCRVLEVGCGRGRGLHLILDRMSGKEVVGIDIDAKMVRTADGTAPISIADMVSLPVRDSGVDAVVDFGALQLVAEWQLAVREVRRVLRPGGRYFFEQIVGPLFRSTMALATGRRMPGGFGQGSLLGELAAVGLKVENLYRPRWMLATGMVGDLIGVARRV